MTARELLDHLHEQHGFGHHELGEVALWGEHPHGLARASRIHANEHQDRGPGHQHEEAP